MAWKGERKVHIDGQIWKWVVVKSRINPHVLVRSPEGKVHKILYEDLYPGFELKEISYGEWEGIGIAPNEVKEYIEIYIINEK